jgi:hypothetical protein
MYFFETRLGEPPFKKVTKDEDWRNCLPPQEPGGGVICDLELKIRFRRSYHEFLREVEDAYGRWVARPTARMLVKQLEKDLKETHREMLFRKVLDNDPIILVANLNYRRSHGKWVVDKSVLHQWRAAQKKIPL